jgi:YVTN family beta-propeller protein
MDMNERTLVQSDLRPAPERKPRRRRPLVIAGAVAFSMVATLWASAMTAPPIRPGHRIGSQAVDSIGRRLTPGPNLIQLGERPYGMALSPNGKVMVVSNAGVADQSVMVVDVAANTVVQTIHYPWPEAVFLGVAFSQDGSHVYVSAGPNDKVRAYAVTGTQLTEQDPLTLSATSFPAGVAVSSDGGTLYAADNLANALSMVDVATGAETVVPLTSEVCPVPTDGFDPSGGKSCFFPYGVVLSKDGGTAYVSNWGQRTVSVVDIQSLSSPSAIQVGTHPSAMVLSRDGESLYVANTDSDSISVIDTGTNTVDRTISVSPYPKAPVGSIPNALRYRPAGARCTSPMLGS